MAHGLVELITYRKIRVMQPDPLFGVAVGRALPYIPVPMTASSTSPVNSARADGRTAAQLRPVRFQNHIAPHATGSTLIEWGNTRVICGVMVEEGVPRWMKEQGVKGGWITAEYSMLPYATLQRKQRDISKGKLDGRSQEIQRLIGRSLRAVIDLEKLGQRTLWVDCDVLQADGGTRTAAITGTYVALSLAVRKLMAAGTLAVNPINQAVAAVSVGMVQERPLLDLCYVEDVAAAVDMNLVMTASGEFVELQGSGEESTFSETQLAALIALGKGGIQDLLALQKAAITQG
jgi:ribonuclease PH